MQFSLHQQWVLLRLQIVIDYIVDIAFFLAPGSLGTGSAWSGFHAPGRPALYFISMASQIYSPKFPKCKMEFPFFLKWSQSSQGTLFLSFFIFSSDLHNWVHRRLTRMTWDCFLPHSLLTGVRETTGLRQLLLSPFLCELPFCLHCMHTLLMTGLPPIPWWISKLITVSMWFLDSIWLSLKSKLAYLRQIIRTKNPAADNASCADLNTKNYWCTFPWVFCWISWA